MSNLIAYHHSHSKGNFALKINNQIHLIDNDVAKYIQYLELEAGRSHLSWTEQLLLSDKSMQKYLTDELSIPLVID